MSTHVEPLMTIDDLDALPDDGYRYEIIEGELFVSRAPNLKHQRVMGKLFGAFLTYLDRNPIGEILTTPGVIFSDYDGVIPDLAFITYERRDEIAAGDRITGAPDLVVEIISPGAENEKRDRVAKRQLYGKYGVKEYWVVDPYLQTIEVYLLEGQRLELKARYSQADELLSSVLPGFACKVESIFGV
ncbi:MAG TPA: Uma2 family endonuclease [Blastocatellia bacterium]|nr:Uma2 family endonuclease [Blastocatellia bacterium]